MITPSTHNPFRTLIEAAIDEREYYYLHHTFYTARGGKRCNVIDGYKARKIRVLEWIYEDLKDEIARAIAERNEPARLQSDAEAFADAIGSKDKKPKEEQQQREDAKK